MILKIEQICKELFSAQFRILHLNEVVGTVEVQGKITSMEAGIRIRLFENEYHMKYVGGFLRTTSIPERKIKTYRPYRICEAFEEQTGSVYQVEKKESWIKTTNFYEMIYHGITYHLYPAAFGAEGGKHSIYCENEQIGQINKASEVRNDLHHYDIYAVNQQAAKLAVLFSLYTYINVFFKPGEKVTKSYTKYMSVTTNKALKEKYNPDFVKTIQP
ncbi:hypothetical protein ACTM90_10000 [Oliverpabstia intestinalis]|uniref:hypothetical protein n=1 Tax=Oliverpabstia intestinalis TaxID=2606633 RepID=UPI003F8C8592